MTAEPLATPCTHAQARVYLKQLPEVAGVVCEDCDRLVRRARQRQPAAPPSLEAATRLVGSDLALYARWVARIEGRACGVEPTIPSGAHERAAQEDERTREFARACGVNRRLDAMRTGAGCLHVAVLRYVYLERTGGTATALGALYADVGHRFSTREVRATWAGKPRRLVLALREAHGRDLHDSACLAYVANTGQPGRHAVDSDNQSKQPAE